jgi:hypothetical protein
MKIFIAGVMQGNRTDNQIYSQNYRKEITDILTPIIHDLEIVDPDITDPNRLQYTNEQAAEMFFRYSFMAGEVDLLISYIPEASMGSAVEMWEAWKNKKPILTISPLKLNWVVKLLSTRVFSTIEEFKAACQNGDLDSFLKG